MFVFLLALQASVVFLSSDPVEELDAFAKLSLEKTPSKKSTRKDSIAKKELARALDWQMDEEMLEDLEWLSHPTGSFSLPSLTKPISKKISPASAKKSLFKATKDDQEKVQYALFNTPSKDLFTTENSTTFIVKRMGSATKLVKKVIIGLKMRHELDMHLHVQKADPTIVPHVLHVQESGLKRDALEIYMQYCQDGDLLDITNRLHAMSAYFASEFAAQLLEMHRIINRLHATGVLHLDIKLENFVKSPKESSFKIIDFGFAQKFKEGEPVKLTQVVGTKNFIAPEVLKMQAIDRTADYFSFGCVLAQVFKLIQDKHAIPEEVRKELSDLYKGLTSDSDRELRKRAWSSVPEVLVKLKDELEDEQ